jgi:hypothetical protein
MGKGLDSSCVAPPPPLQENTVSEVGRNRDRSIVPFFMLLLFKALTPLTLVFNPALCISATDDVAQILVVPISSLAAFLWWSEIACRVPVLTLPVVRLMTPCFIISVETWL